jgi:hypothetical protein
MTERQWLTSHHPEPMLLHLDRERRLDRRKARLFAAACCRRVAHLLSDWGSREALEVAERHADGLFSDLDLDRAQRAARGAAAGERQNAAAAFAVLFLTGAVSFASDRLHLARAVGSNAAEAAGDAGDEDQSTTAHYSERVAQARLLRELFGNPFRSVTANRAWLGWNDGTVGKIARVVYQERCFAEMPVLADALEEAGCADGDLLAHCRQSAEHFRGCWVLDLLLART